MKSAALKTIALILLLAAACFFDAHEQAAARSSSASLVQQCPAISVACPDASVSGGQPVTFTASIDSNYSNPRLTFNWTVSAGRIISGQGTNEIKVDATGLAVQAIRATLEVGGLPYACVRTASCETAIAPDCRPPIFDEYGDISWLDEQTRLDNFAIQLQYAPTVAGHIIAYAGRRARAGEAQARAARAKNYLANVRGINPARLVTVDGGFREQPTVALWIVPAGMSAVEPTPTLEPREVETIPASAQNCPTISVSCPDTVGADPISYTARVSGGSENLRPIFNWTITAGTIISGQGTSAITVDPTEAGGRTIVTSVAVEGLPTECSKMAECATAVIIDPMARKFDEYSPLSLAVERERLNNFALQLQSDMQTRGVIIAYGGRRGRAGEALARANRATDYLVNVRGIDPRRIETEDGGFREQLTVELWIVAPGVFGPTATPTVDPREVEMITPPARRRGARRRP